MEIDFLIQIEKFVLEHYLNKERILDSDQTVHGIAHKTFSELNLCNWWVSKKFEGGGILLEDSVDIVVKLSYGDAGTTMGLYFSILSNRVVGPHGTNAQKERFVIPLVKNNAYSGIAGSKEVSGSEMLNIAAFAKRENSKHISNGVNCFCANAGYADFVVVICAPPEEDELFRAIIVSIETPGMIIKRRWANFGLKSSVAFKILFTNCEVPAENTLESNVLCLLEVGLNASRVLKAASGIGIAKRIGDICLEYAKPKKLKGSTLLENHVFASKLGKIEADIFAMTVICRIAAREYDAIYNDLYVKSQRVIGLENRYFGIRNIRRRKRISYRKTSARYAIHHNCRGWSRCRQGSSLWELCKKSWPVANVI